MTHSSIQPRAELGRTFSGAGKATEEFKIMAVLAVAGVVAEELDERGTLDVLKLDDIAVMMNKEDAEYFRLERRKGTIFFFEINPFNEYRTPWFRKIEGDRSGHAGCCKNFPKSIFEAAKSVLVEKNLYFRINKPWDNHLTPEYLSINGEQYATLREFPSDPHNFKRVDLKHYESDLVYQLVQGELPEEEEEE